MRTDNNRFEGWIGTGPYSGEIARRVDYRGQTGVAHQLHGISPTGHVSIGISDPAYSVGKGPSRRPPELAELFERTL